MVWLTKLTYAVNPKFHDNGISPDDWDKMMRELEALEQEFYAIPRKYLKEVS